MISAASLRTRTHQRERGPIARPNILLLNNLDFEGRNRSVSNRAEP
jgi:hypothetical protein